jgi:hypothetical protein
MTLQLTFSEFSEYLVSESSQYVDAHTKNEIDLIGRFLFEQSAFIGLSQAHDLEFDLGGQGIYL